MKVLSTNSLGFLLGAIGTMGLGLAVAFSRYAYEGGTNAATVSSTRTVLMLLILGCWCLLTHKDMRLSRRDWLHHAGLGLLLIMMVYGNIAAVQYIPVGLAALLFFTFPPMIALLHAVVLREHLTPSRLVAIVLAFTGLFLMLGVSWQDSDWRGVVLALSAALATAWNAVWLMRKLRHMDSVVATFHMTLIATPILIMLTYFSGNFVLPDKPIGWFGLFTVASLQALSLPLYFAAIKLIGSLKTGMISNVQPVTSIVAAYFLFGEVLAAPQLLGGVMVLVGIFLMQWYDKRKA